MDEVFYAVYAAFDGVHDYFGSMLNFVPVPSKAIDRIKCQMFRRDPISFPFIGEEGDKLRDVFPAPLRSGVEFSDDFFIVKHHQSLAQLVTDHLVPQQGVAAVQRIR